ncbi:hypothetical protein C8T65DRAFT_807981 [Cerioporus squamosus]|nr:hypothetical protein C8T65DRAFT_807981 [Cerioporus squamosus]
MRRSQDVIDPASHPDIMTLSHEDDHETNSGNVHPYWYSRVIHIFHINVYRTDAVPGTPASRPQRMDILWVRWFGLDPTTPHGFKAKRHPRIGFVPHDDGIPFGFLDPTVVIRGSHIMPVPSYDHTPDLLPPSIARHGQNVYEKPEYHDQDYQYYVVNMFVDRDMLMRYLGGGVGHADTGPDIQIAFDDEDFTWEDVDPEAADLFEPSDDDEPEISALRTGPSSSGTASEGQEDGVTPEQRVLRLVQGLDGLAETEEDRARPSGNTDGQEDGEDDEDGPEDDEAEAEDEELGRDPEDERDEDDDGDEFGQEGYAAD